MVTFIGHSILYPLLVLGWIPFSFRTVLILHGMDSDLLVHTDLIASHICSRFLGIALICSVGLTLCDCGGQLSTVNSFSCSRNQIKMISLL